jgi:ATP-binding cassette, subfamily B, bacterial
VIETVRGCAELFRLCWRQNRVQLLVSILLKLGEAAALPMSAYALRWLTDAAIAGQPGAATAAAFVAAGSVLGALTLGHFAHVCYYELGEINFLTNDLELISLANDSDGIEHHERPDYADKLQVLKQELQRTGWSGMESLMSGLGLIVAMAMSGVLLAGLDPWLLLLPVAVLPPLLLGRQAQGWQSRAREAAAQPTRLAWHLFNLTTSAEPAKEVRACGLGGEIRARHRALWADATHGLWKAEARAALLRMAGQVIFACAYVGATLLVVRAAVDGRRTVGDVVLVISLAGLVNQQVATAVTLVQDLQRVAAALAGLRWLRRLVARQEPDQRARAAPPDRVRHGIRFRDVTFTYPGRSEAALEHFDLWLPAGSTVAIVGENGAGKTTLVKLLCRYYEPCEGSIELDEVSISRFPVRQWRERIAAAFQDYVRFEFRARESVGVGDLPRLDSPVALAAALDRAQAGDVVGQLPAGLETPLGKSYTAGVQLSGGQWQKIALSRAMMRAAPLLLILDEPTAALDAESEYQLFARYAAGAKRVAAESGGITVLVSHRFSTVRMADLIVVVAGGRVVEVGDHEELMANESVYAEMYCLQEAAYR